MKLIRTNNYIPRQELQEGRTTELGFGFAKKVENGFELVSDISACKDYLNDVVYGEKFQISQTPHIHGFSHKYQNLFENNPVLIITMLNNKNNNWSEYTSSRVKLIKNINKIVKFVHSIEEKLGYTKTKLTKLRGYYAVEFDKRWVSDNYMISFYTLLYRIQFNYEGRGILKDFNKIPKNVVLSHQINRFNKNFKALLNGTNKPFLTKSTNISSVHHSGFLSTDI